jgi:hypothetical protein
VARQVIASQRTSSPVRSILIAGHTDHVGSDDYNFDLAGRRAHAVLRELCTTLTRMSPGIIRQIRFDVTSCGERQPKASDDLRRRVEVFLPQRITPPPPPPVPSRLPVCSNLAVWINAFLPRDVAGYTLVVPAGMHRGKTAVPCPPIALPANPHCLGRGYLTDQVL